MKSLVAGDTHGNTTAIRRALHYAQKQGCDEVIQVGDFGFGWTRSATGDAFVESVSRAALAYEIDVYWFDGNHENFDKLEELGLLDADAPIEMCPRVWYIPRGTVIERSGKRILIVGGAYSVDKPYRTPHVSWWPQEEVRHRDLLKCYEAGKVDVVLSHDAPEDVFRSALRLASDTETEMEHLVWKNGHLFPDAIPNRMALQTVLESAQPSLWIHGHYHAGYQTEVDGMRVLGLDMECDPGALAVVDFGVAPVDFDLIVG